MQVVGHMMGNEPSKENETGKGGTFEGMPNPSWRRIALLALLSLALVLLIALVLALLKS